MIRRLLILLIAIVFSAAGFGVWWVNQPLLPANAATGVEVSIDMGSSSKAIARAVAKVTGSNAMLLYAWFRASGRARQIQAGTFAIEPSLTPYKLLQKMISGDEVMLALTIPEGWTFAQMRSLINTAPSLQHITADWTDAQLMAQLGQANVFSEGRFSPNTYTYPKNGSDLQIYKQAAAALDQHLSAAWQGRWRGLPLRSSDELLTLASIVEKETGSPSDRPEIAGVFVNRLKAGMLLQTDPTVIYGMGERFVQQQGHIYKSDLKRDTPYNTYTRAGLPPSPIALVGQAALEAVSHPKSTNSLYFVARGDGTSQFSSTLGAHNAAVKQYILGAK